MYKRKRNRTRNRRNKNKNQITTITNGSSNSTNNLKRDDQGIRQPPQATAATTKASTSTLVSQGSNARNRTFSLSSTGSGVTTSSSSSEEKLTPPIGRSESTALINDSEHDPDRKVMLDYVKDMSFPGITIDSRHDYSNFQRLPRQKCNGYYIRVEDDNKRPDDEKIRKLILLTLRANGTNRSVFCLFSKKDKIFK